MQRNPDFRLREINQKFYLLPTCQAMTDFKRGIQLNNVGLLLWNHLSEEICEEELLALLYQEYEPEENEKQILIQDLNHFLNTLRNHDMLLPIEKDINTFPLCNQFSIAGLFLDIYAPIEALHENLVSFRVDKPIKKADLCISLAFQKPPVHPNGNILLRNQQLILIENNTSYVVLFPEYEDIYEVHIEKNSLKAVVFCNNDINDSFREELFHTLRIPFLYAAALHHILMIHSASICYKEKAFLFSASSGTGKSTHTNLWNKEYKVPLINGDLNLIGLLDGKPTVFGTPWCGTSGIYDTKTYPLGGIVFLKQNSKDYVETLDEEEKRLSVLLRCISPTFHDAILDNHLQVIDKIAEQILICRLHCTPTKAAVEAIKNVIDSSTDI